MKRLIAEQKRKMQAKNIRTGEQAKDEDLK